MRWVSSSSAALPSGATQDADALVLTLTNVGVFVGVGGSLSDTTDGEANNTPNDYSDDEVLDGTLGFGATVSKLTLVSLKDRGATAAKTDDRTYLGVALQGLDGNLVGLDDVLVFHAYNVDALVNKATDGNGNDAQPKLDWSEFGAHGTDYTGLNIDAALGELNGTSLGDLNTGVDVAVGGGVALDVLNGVLVVKGDFSIALGQLSSAALPSGATQDADALVLTLTNVGVFVGVGGSLSDTTDGEANNTPNDYSDDEVLDGTLGFGATVSKLTLVSLKDRGANRTYLGVALQGLDGNLVGLDDVLVFHAYNVDALVNKVAGGAGQTDLDKLDWSEFGAHGTDYTGLNIDAALGELNGTSLGDLNAGVDVAVGGGVALNVLDGIIVATGSFSVHLGTMTYLGADGAAGGSDDVAYQAMVLTLTNVGVFVGVGGSLSDTTDGEANNTPNDYSDDEVNYDGGVGFYASLDSLTLVTLKDTNGTPQKSYLALDVSGVDAGFKGIDHLTLNVRDASIQVNQAKDSDATPPPKLDWTKFTNANTTGLQLPALAVDDKVDIKAAGNVAIDVDGFVQVFGSFAFSKLTNIEVTSVVSAGPSAGTPTQRTVNVMTFGLENVNVFVGAGPYFQDADDDGVADTDVHGDDDRRRRRDRPGAPRRVARACAVQADRSRGQLLRGPRPRRTRWTSPASISRVRACSR